MPQITDSTLVQLDADYESSGDLYLLYGSSRLPTTEPHLQIDLIDLSQTQLKLIDFVENGVTQELYAHRIGASGSLTAWTRTTGAVESPIFTYPQNPPADVIEEFDLMVKAVAQGGAAPSYTTEAQAEQGGAVRIKVKIIKHKSRPEGFVERR